MGKKRPYRGNNADDRKRRKDTHEQWKSERGDDRRNDWSVMKNNARFDAYYKAQGFVSPGDDWDSFLAHLKRELPACFRINSDYKFADQLREQMLAFVGNRMEVDGVEIAPVQPIAWYPNGYGYKLGTDRKSIRKLDALTELHQWMIKQTEFGNITRQEAVSMVPPLALDVKPHHKCLDMCAAPGSKTSQLLETINRSVSNPDQSQHGVVVANDADTDRAYMLVHQCRRTNSPSLVITTHKGQQFPSMRYIDSELKGEYFDRVLCDVPCSGDGTMRKNPMIWGRWNTNGAIALHVLQILIATRGIQLLKPGGLMVYSTCSMSPIEDEAVVAELLRTHPDLELVDARECIARSHGLPEGVAPPTFRARAGMHFWHVLDDYKMVTQEIIAKRRQKRQERSREHRTAKEAKQSEDAGEEDAENDEDKQSEVENEGNGSEEVVAEEAQGAAAASAMDADYVTEEGPADGLTRAQRLFPDLTNEYLVEAINMGMDYYPTFESAQAVNHRTLRKSMFPPTAEELSWMGLERCLRCVPQDEDTGGFFVATFRKKDRNSEKSTESAAAEVSMSAEEVAAAEAAAEAGEENDGKSKHRHNSNQDKNKALGAIVEYKQWDTEAFRVIQDFYGIEGSTIKASNFFVRYDHAQTAKIMQHRQRQMKAAGRDPGDMDEQKLSNKTIYYIPDNVSQILHTSGLKVVAAGVKVFEKRNTSSSYTAVLNQAADSSTVTAAGANVVQDYRLLQEGLHVLAPYMTHRQVHITLQDLCNMLAGGLVSYSTLDSNTITQLIAQSIGCVICSHRHVDATTGTEHVFRMVCWRGTSRTVNVMCHKTDLDHITHQLQTLGILL